MESTKVYEIMAVDKKLAKIFFDKMYLAFCKLIDYYDRKYKTKTESIGLANDNTCFISNKMYVEQVLHYDKSIYEKYGKKWRSLHTDGPSDHNFKTFADELKLNYMDIGGWSSIDFACKYMKGKVIIHGGLNNKDLYNGLDEKVKEKIKQAIKIAAPSGGYVFAIGGETYPGVAPETLIELVKYVKVVGKYPVNL
jgi:uroporphyrinogen-III decarboxylase